LRYFTLNRLFADECEAVSGRSGTALKGIINVQITDFIHIFADSERQNLALAMQSDKWDAKDFTDDDSKVLSNILSAMTSDPPAYISQSYIWDDPHTNGTSDPPTNGTPTKKKTRPAVIEEDKFILAPSVTFLLHGISRFEILVACMPSIASDVSQALVDYLKLFNSLSCQLILGAGAMRSSAGLKRINTKHLALASQALGCVIAVIPYVREFVRRRPGMTGTALGEYDKTKRLYQDHQVSIHEKLVEIMSSRAALQVKAMEAVDWDADATRQASAHMETLTEETALLQRVLGRHMPEPTVQGIMLPVFASYKAQWGRAFREARPQTPAGKTRLVSRTWRLSIANISAGSCAMRNCSCRGLEGWRAVGTRSVSTSLGSSAARWLLLERRRTRPQKRRSRQRTRRRIRRRRRLKNRDRTSACDHACLNSMPPLAEAGGGLNIN
jgi:vacuolar protein sorting-associated protein 54